MRHQRNGDINLNILECKQWDYPEKLPAVSVILVFHNEGNYDFYEITDLVHIKTLVNSP